MLANCELNDVCTFLFSTLENIINFLERVGQQRTVVSKGDHAILTDKREHYLAYNVYKSLDNYEA